MILLHAWGFVDVEETSVLVVDGRRGSVALVTTMSAEEEEGKKEGEESDDTSSDSSSDDGGVAVRWQLRRSAGFREQRRKIETYTVDPPPLATEPEAASASFVPFLVEKSKSERSAS
jgi:hypothetical protein